MALTLTPTGTPGARVLDSMFGANMLAHINTINPGLDQTLDTFGISTIRWPGGSVTENHFDPKNPDVPLPNSRNTDEKSMFKDTVMTFTDTMQWAAKNGTPISLVIPTRHLLTTDGRIDPVGLADMRVFLTHALSKGGAYADATIASIEVGNEYWGTQMTAAQYGAVANTLVGLITQVVGATKPDTKPLILVQKGAAYGVDNREGGQYAHLSWGDKIRQANADIIAELSPQSRAAIDGVISHYYHIDRDADMSHNTSGAWANRLVQSIWSGAGITDSLHFTEWNVRMSDGVKAGEPLFAGAGILIEQFEIMMRMNPGAAYIWPVNQRTNSDLAGPTNTDPGKLSVNGAAFKVLSDNVRGLAFQELNVESSDRFETSLYTGAASAVVFISESAGRTLHESLNLSGVLPPKPHGASLNVTIQTITRDPSMDAFVGKEQGAIINTPFSGPVPNLAHLSDITLALNPYEVAVIRMDWVLPTPMRDTTKPIVYGTDGNDIILAGLPHQTIHGGNGDDRIHGGGGNNLLRGNNGHDVLHGGAGNDTLWGGADHDTLNGDIGQDLLYGEDGHDRLLGGNDADRLLGGAGNDTLHGEQGNDTLFGEDGNDVLQGGGGNNSLNGGAGNDSLFGGDGRDVLMGGGGHDVVWGGAHNDTLDGGAGNDRLWGESGNDRLNGGDGNDTLFGGSGVDILLGGAGDDHLIGGGTLNTLYGGTGNDTFYFGRGAHPQAAYSTSDAYGGAGRDFFVFGGSTGRTSIHDFQNGMDKIRFMDSHINSLDDLTIKAYKTHVDIVFDGGTIRLHDTPLHHIDASDFLF